MLLAPGGGYWIPVSGCAGTGMTAEEVVDACTSLRRHPGIMKKGRRFPAGPFDVV
jgi:hypothetical protein